MSVLRAVARPMLAAIFLAEGYQNLLRPGRAAPAAEPIVRPLARRVSAVPADPEQAVRLNGAVQLAAGTLLAIGRFPRLAALAIAGTLVPTTLAGHRFWEEQDKIDRDQQRIHFLKNAAILGGLLIAAADTGGRPSLAWRSKHAVRDARRSAKTAKVSGKAAAKAGARAGKLAGRVPGS